MTMIGDQRDEFDPVQELLSMVESIKSKDKHVPRLSTDEYAKQHKEKLLTKHRQRIRDGFVGEEERNLPKRSKLGLGEQVDQLTRYRREIFPLAFRKMVHAQKEAVQKLYPPEVVQDPLVFLKMVDAQEEAVKKGVVENKLYQPGVVYNHPHIFQKMMQAQHKAIMKLLDHGVLDNYPLIFDKMAEAQKEAVNEFYGRQMPDAPYEKFCDGWGELKISP
ncbi:hypothetical protein OROHE_016823 [Orobanche hederae]